MPSAIDQYASLMKHHLGPALRQEGFRGSSPRFALPDEEVWRLLGFQKSAFGDRLHTRFTMNLSTIDRVVWDRRRSVDARMPVQPRANTFYGSRARQTRIGRLIPGEGAGDLWWDVYPDTDVERLSDEIARAVRDHGLPWLRDYVAL